MSSHNDHSHDTNEKKSVSFGTPLIMALVLVLIILLAVSTCDKKHDHAGTDHKGTHAVEAAAEAPAHH